MDLFNDENNNINCSVNGCNYNSGKGKCTLKNIQISTTKGKKYNCREDTVCSSFCPSVNIDYEMAEEIIEELAC